MSIFTPARELGAPVADPDLAPVPGNPRRRRTGRHPHRRSRVNRARDLAREHRVGGAVSFSALVAAASVAFGWFRTGTYFATGDLAPWIRDSLRDENGWQWTHQNSGAGGPTYELVRATELVSISIARLLGGTDALGQRLFFAAAFAFAAAGTAYFASRLTRRTPLIVVAGILGAFNPFVMVNLTNFLLPLTIGLVGVFGGLALDAANGRRTRPRLFAVIALVSSYLAINPPLLVLLGVWLLALPIVAPALTGRGLSGMRKVVGFLGRALCWSAPLAAWWVVPYAFALTGSADSDTVVANTNVVAWAWTHAHGSLDRVLALVAKWGWPTTDPASHASFLAGSGWVWLAFVLPMGAMLAPLVARPRRRRAALWGLTGVLVVCAFAKGINAPFRQLNMWAYAHVPGLWLFREPAAKFGVLIAIGLVLLWVLALDGLMIRRRVLRRRRSALTPATSALIVAFLAAPLAFAWPMLTGAVVPSSQRVTVPRAWRDVAAIVNDSPNQGKTLVLPLDDFYQMPTTWGFYGADTVVRQLLTRPAITRNPQAYIGDPLTYDALMGAAQTGIAEGDPTAVPGALRALGVSHVIVRKDIDYDSKIRVPDVPRPRALLAGVIAVQGIRRVASTPVADVFEYSGGADPVEALGGTINASDAEGVGLATIAASAPPGLAITTSPAPLRRGSAWYVDANHGITVTAPAAGTWRYERRSSGTPIAEIAAEPNGLVLQDAARLSIDGSPIAARPDVVVPTTTRPGAVAIDGELFDLSGGSEFVRLAPGTVVEPFESGAANNVGVWSAYGDCARYDDQPPAASRLGAEYGGDYGRENAVLRLTARLHTACIWSEISNVTGGDLIRVSVEQRAVRGAAPRTCLWQIGPDRCAPLEFESTREGDWYSLQTLYRVPTDVTDLRLFLYADEPAPGTTTDSEAWYRHPTLERLRPAATTTIRPRPQPTGAVQLPDHPVRVESVVAVDRPALGARSEVGDCARQSGATLASAHITAQSLGGDDRIADPSQVRLHATSGSACVNMPVTGVRRSIAYELTFHARVQSGTFPRVCLWEDLRQRCARLESIDAPPSGSGTYKLRTPTNLGDADLFLYLYADGVGGGTTIEYRGAQLRPIAEEALVLLPEHTTVGAVPDVTWHRDGPARYRVEVSGATEPFVLALADAWSSDWRVEGLPGGATARQLKIDGYRNGWVISGLRRAHLTLTYVPARYGRAAIRVSQVTAVLLVGSFFVAPLRRCHRARRRRVRHVRLTGPGDGSRQVPYPQDWLLPAPSPDR